MIHNDLTQSYFFWDSIFFFLQTASLQGLQAGAAAAAAAAANKQQTGQTPRMTALSLQQQMLQNQYQMNVSFLSLFLSWSDPSLNRHGNKVLIIFFYSYYCLGFFYFMVGP